jgi:hypothetical protein
VRHAVLTAAWQSTLTWRRAQYVCRDNLGQHLLALGLDALIGTAALQQPPCQHPHCPWCSAPPWARSH